MSYPLLALVCKSELAVCYSDHSFLCYERIFAYTNHTAVNSSTCSCHRRHNHSSSSSCEDRGPRDDRLYADSMSSESVERTGRESRLGWELKQVTSSHLPSRSSSRRCTMGLSTTLTPTMTPRTKIMTSYKSAHQRLIGSLITRIRHDNARKSTHLKDYDVLHDSLAYYFHYCSPPNTLRCYLSLLLW